jgi:hypothetical protein
VLAQVSRTIHGARERTTGIKTGGVALVLGLAIAVGFSPAVARAADPHWSVSYDSGQYWLSGSGTLTDIQVNNPDGYFLDQQYHGFFDCFSPDYYVDGACPIFLNGEEGYIAVTTQEYGAEDVYVPAAS